MASAGDCSRFQLSHWLLQLPGRPPHQGSLSEGRIPGRTLGNGLLLEYVYLEVITVLLTRAGAAVAVKAGSDLLESKEFEFVSCSELFAETVRKFNAQQHTKLSFTDIAIATVALKRADGLVLTFDEEFRNVPAIRLAE